MSRKLRVALHPAQQEIFNSEARFKVVPAGRRFGKSFLAAFLLLLEALKDTDRIGRPLGQEHMVLYVAPTFSQAQTTIRPQLIKIAGPVGPNNIIVRENVNDGWFELCNGRRIYVRGAENYDRLRGLSLSFVVLDEYADMHPDVWDYVVRPALMDTQGGALFIGTPKGKNHFYELYKSAGEGRPGYEKNWAAFTYSSEANPIVTQDELIDMVGVNKPLDIQRQELEAEFVSSGGDVLNSDLIEILDEVPESASGSIIVTVDLAGFQKAKRKVVKTDESVICVTLATPDNWYVKEVLHGHWDVRETALKIVQTIQKYPGSRVGIEQGALSNAVGPYLEDYMKQHRAYVRIIPLKHGNTKKLDRITWALQGRIDREKIKFIKGKWNTWLLEQMADFPDPRSHDDGIDALAYVDQLYKPVRFVPRPKDQWEPLDDIAGY